MIVSNDTLQKLFVDGKKNKNWDPFFKEVRKIIKFTLNNKFSNIAKYHYDTVESLEQDCCLRVWNLVLRNQIKEGGNIFSYIIGSVSYLMRDEIRKSNRRRKKANITRLDDSLKI
jgi:DNA-directed RNA polymerase specialized sigma24 family protein